VRVATMETLFAAPQAERHFALILLQAFGIEALVLAAAGIYAVPSGVEISGGVTERMREIGVRCAGRV
jgi:putative ABC transport system permease protein